MSTQDNPKLDEAAMRLAIKISEEALATGDSPYGAVLVDSNGKTLLSAANQQNTGNDCTAHAEIQALRKAQKELGLDGLRGTTIYASGEPCAMCAAALFWAGVEHVVYAVPKKDMDELFGGPTLSGDSASLLESATPPVRVSGPFLRDEALAVLRRAAAQG